MSSNFFGLVICTVPFAALLMPTAKSGTVNKWAVSDTLSWVVYLLFYIGCFVIESVESG